MQKECDIYKNQIIYLLISHEPHIQMDYNT